MYTDFGKQVHIALIKKDLTVNALTDELNRRYGTKYGPEYVSKVLHGYASKPMRERIAEVLELEEVSEYA